MTKRKEHNTQIEKHSTWSLKGYLILLMYNILFLVKRGQGNDPSLSSGWVLKANLQLQHSIAHLFSFSFFVTALKVAVWLGQDWRLGCPLLSCFFTCQENRELHCKLCSDKKTSMPTDLKEEQTSPAFCRHGNQDWESLAYPPKTCSNPVAQLGTALRVPDCGYYDVLLLCLYVSFLYTFKPEVSLSDLPAQHPTLKPLHEATLQSLWQLCAYLCVAQCILRKTKGGKNSHNVATLPFPSCQTVMFVCNNTISLQTIQTILCFAKQNCFWPSDCFFPFMPKNYSSLQFLLKDVPPGFSLCCQGWKDSSFSLTWLKRVCDKLEPGCRAWKKEIISLLFGPDK